MTENILTAPTLSRFGSEAGFLFSNLESFPGQVYTTPQLQSAKQENIKTRDQIVRATRQLERTSELIRGGIDKKTDYVVGSRLMVHARPDWDILGIDDHDRQDKVARAFERQFRDWGSDPRMLQDGEGHCDFGSMMWLAFREVTGPAGECAMIVHMDAKRARDYGWKWGTYLTVIDSQRIKTPPDQTGNKNVAQGLVRDKDGRRIGMYVTEDHPGDASPESIKFTLVPRETKTGRPVGIHWFPKFRPSQIRGITTLVSIVKQTGMVDNFDDQYLAAAVINATLATWIESPAPAVQVAENLAPGAKNSVDTMWGLFEHKVGFYDKAKIRIGGARIPVLPMGDKINMSAVDRAMNDPSGMRDNYVRMMASALGLSFEQFAQKFSDANFSAARAAIIDAWPGIMRLRHQFSQAVAALVYGAVIEEAISKGLVEGVTLAEFHANRSAWSACEFTGPGMPQIDPQKEAAAYKLLLDLKLSSRQAIIAGMGSNYVDVFDQIAKENEEAEERGFNLEILAPGTPGAEEAQSSGDGGEGGSSRKRNQKTGGGGQPARDGDGDGQTNEET